MKHKYLGNSYYLVWLVINGQDCFQRVVHREQLAYLLAINS